MDFLPFFILRYSLSEKPYEFKCTHVFFIHFSTHYFNAVYVFIFLPMADAFIIIHMWIIILVFKLIIIFYHVMFVVFSLFCIDVYGLFFLMRFAYIHMFFRINFPFF